MTLASIRRAALPPFIFACLKMAMNYRHAFHAGNHADVLKHIVLAWCLAHLRKKRAPYAVLDTHAGPGLYDLWGDEARRSPEWQEGAAKLWDWSDAPWPLQPYRRLLLALNAEGLDPGLSPRARLNAFFQAPQTGDVFDAPPFGVWPEFAASSLRFYPGSPVLIRAAMREGDPKTQDRLLACELHPDDVKTLKTSFRNDRSAHVHARDGWEALHALLPFPERRGLVLIDPPYEQEGELARSAREIAAALPRFPGGTFIWWRPLKDSSGLDAADAELRQQMQSLPAKPTIVRADFGVAALTREGKLIASSVLIVNPPYDEMFSLSAVLNIALPALTERLATGPGAFWRVS